MNRISEGAPLTINLGQDTAVLQRLQRRFWRNNSLFYRHRLENHEEPASVIKNYTHSMKLRSVDNGSYMTSETV